MKTNIMKIFSMLRFKEIFVLLFTPLLFVSDLLRNLFPVNDEGLSFVLLNRFILILVFLFVLLYAFQVSRAMDKIQIESKNIKNFITLVLALLTTYYISTFINPLEGMFFGYFLLSSLAINFVITLVLVFMVQRIVKT